MEITQEQSFDALRIFLDEYWERGGRTSNDLANLLSSLDNFKTISRYPLDPALWYDWERACQKAKAMPPWPKEPPPR